ncbi:hypothetical protein ITJ38_03995 [Agreia pratensis]|uniref:hypothetical protein n=1 Tax=Agreia pratensis TaxID=150121 RepID=UPI00188AE73A|nr:hypothetical protein [Agreia pratensis]MBF4633563.1 hypothetical protein [Agreia pratensis]
MSSTTRNRRTKDPDRVKFNRGRLVILAGVLLMGGAVTLTSRLVQNGTASALVIIALLVVFVLAVGRTIQLINRTVDDRYRGMRDANRAWAASIGGSFDATAAPPPPEISSIAFAEDRRVLVPVTASEVVSGDWRGRPFEAMHLSGYEKLRPGVDAKGRDVSTNLVYLALPHALPDLRIMSGSVARDYGRPMTEVVIPHDGVGGWWRIQSDDPTRSVALMNADVRELLNGWGSPIRIAATGRYLISYGDPTGDADAIAAQLDFLTAFADRIPRGALLGDAAD